MNIWCDSWRSVFDVIKGLHFSLFWTKKMQFKSQNWYFLTFISISILVWILWSTETLILNLFCTRKYYKQKTQNQSFSYLLQIFAPINNRDPQPEIYEEIKQTAVVRIQVNDDRVNASNLNEGKQRELNNLFIRSNT